MSQFQSFPSSPNRTNNIPRQGIDNLQVGAIPNQPVAISPRATMGAQLLEIAQQGAQVFERASAMHLETSRQAKAVLRGRATQEADVALTELPAEFEAMSLGDMTQVHEDGGPEAYVDRWIATKTEGMDEESKQAFAGRAKVNALHMLTQRDRALTQANRKELANNIAQGMFVAESAGELKQLAKDIRMVNPDVSETASLRPVLAVAQQAAKAGDTKMTRMALEALGDKFPGDQELVHEQLQQTIDGKRIEEMGRRVNQIKALILDDAPAEMIEEELQYMEQSSTDDNLALAQAGTLRAQLKQREQAKVGEAQDGHYQNTVLKILNRQWEKDEEGNASIQATMAQILADASLPRDDPRHITPTTASGLINTIGHGMEQDAKLSVVRNHTEVNAPLGADFDAAIATHLGSIGAVVGVQDGRNFAVTDLKNPTALAKEAARLGRLPTSVSDLIGRGLSGDADQAQRAAIAYTFIRQQSPAVADQVFGRMDPTAKLRARYIDSRMSGVSPLTGGAAEQAMQLAQESLNFQASSLEPDQIKTMAWLPEDEAQDADAIKKLTAPKVRQMARDHIIEGIEDGLMLRTDPAWFNHGRMPTRVPPEFVNDYIGIFEEEFALASQIEPTTEAAQQKAKDVAFARFFNTHQPISWNGVGLFDTGRGPSTTPDFQERVYDEMRKRLKDRPEHIVDDYIEQLEDSTPRFDKGLNGWVFIVEGLGNAPINMGLGRDEDIFVCNPYLSQPVQSAAERFEKMRAKADRLKQARIEAAHNGMRYFSP